MAMTNHERFIYSPEHLVKGFSQVSSDVVDTPTSQLLVKWYRSPYVDLQVWINQKSKKVVRQQFSFLGVVVEWNHIQGLKTGIVEDVKSHLNHKSWSVNIIYDSTCISASLDQALEVINLTGEFEERASVIDNYKKNPTLTKWQSFMLIFSHLFAKKNKKT